MAGHHHHHHQPQVDEPTISLLRMSAGQRLLGVAGLLAALWAAVAWAAQAT